MKVILLERVERLGAIGDVVVVKDGFARNFLLPRSKALRANNANLKVFEAQRGQIEARNQQARADAETAGSKLEGETYVMIRQAGESGQLYGSVSGRDVADAVQAEGGKVDRSQIVLDKPIKTLGLHEVKVRLHAEVTITVKINIARSADEAERQGKGENVIFFGVRGRSRPGGRTGPGHAPGRRRLAGRRPRLRGLILTTIAADCGAGRKLRAVFDSAVALLGWMGRFGDIDLSDGFQLWIVGEVGRRDEPQPIPRHLDLGGGERLGHELRADELVIREQHMGGAVRAEQSGLGDARADLDDLTAGKAVAEVVEGELSHSPRLSPFRPLFEALVPGEKDLARIGGCALGIPRDELGERYCPHADLLHRLDHDHPVEAVDPEGDGDMAPRAFG